MRIGSLTRNTLVLLGSLSAVLMGGCPNVNPNGNGNDNSSSSTPQNGAAKLRPFNSAGEMQSYLQGQVNAQNANYGVGGRDVLAGAAEGGAVTDSAAPPAAPVPGADNGSFSTTNVQEIGVDESDVIKSDGTNFYIARGQTLRVVRANPLRQLDEIAKLALDGSVDSLYLVGDHLITLGTKFDFSPRPGAPGRPEILIYPPYYSSSSVLLTQIDISDPAHPRKTHSMTLDGSLVSSRLTNGRLVLVVAIVPNVVPAVQTVINLVPPTPTPLAEMLPKMHTTDGDHVMVDWSDSLRPENPDGYYMTAVMTIDADNVESVKSRVGIVGNAGTIYASTDALYVTNASYDPSNNYRENTEIHKFRFEDDGSAKYVASGRVRGRLLNQFSLGENNGFLRLATTIDPTFGGVGVGFAGGGVAVDVAAPPPTAQTRSDETTVSTDPGTGASTPPVQQQPANAVFVLKQDGRDLVVAGSVRNIAAGERLYSARFIGDRGYLVTFKQIDPLFVLDLTNPEKPRLTGQLELPGYSDYLHPFGENLLIGVGRSVEAFPGGFSEPSRLQLSLFDVSDARHPLLVQQIQLGGRGSYTDVSYDAKAFTFLPSRGLLVMPVQLYSDIGGNSYIFGDVAFEGVVALHVTDAGFEDLGSLAAVVNPNYGWVPWRRAAVIDDNIFAITPAGVSGAPLDNLDAARRTRLSAGPEDNLFEGDKVYPLGVPGDVGVATEGRPN